MKELIGHCSCCGKEVFCLDGFFNAIHTDDKKIICFDCHNNVNDKTNSPNEKLIQVKKEV